jgi:hypothetical protein
MKRTALWGRLGDMVKTGQALAAIATAVLIMAAAPSPAGAKTTHKTTAQSPPKLAQAGHGTFWECSAKSTGLLVGVNRLTLHPSQVLNLDFIAKNNGTTPCNYVAPYVSGGTGVVSTALQIGPCGSMGFTIEGQHHRNVWPGVAAFNCPALGFAQLQPGASVIGSGSWAQTSPNSLKRVRPGRYTIVVDGQFKFPLTIAAH